jgi:iron complex outermembrane receptor protein
MYSTRFGSFINNPNLQPERSHYSQIGVADTMFDTKVVVNAFYARITNAITSVAISPTVSESENVGVAKHYGFEIELSRQFLPGLDGGINFSELIRTEVSGGAILTDTPGQKLFAYIDWYPIPQLAIVPNVDYQSKRLLQNAVNMQVYYHGGAFTLTGIKASYKPIDPLTIELGVNNLMDRDYVMYDGYNGVGRQYFANVRVSF